MQTHSPAPKHENIHFIGICGTGMAGLACMLKDLGHTVSGSDESTYPPMSDMLARAGIAVARFDESNISASLDSIVLGAGVSRNNSEATAAIRRGLRVLSCPAALAHYVLAGHDAHVVAGTHGKTTTASMLAWIHEKSGGHPGFFIGGAPKNFSRSARLPKGGAVIVEGDEYKSSNLDLQPKFLKYAPRLAVITNIEYDHADVFADFRAVIGAFAALTRSIKEDGALVISANPEVIGEMRRAARCRVITVGRDPVSDWRVIDRWEGATRMVAIHAQDASVLPIGPFSLRIPGRHNVDNAALAAVAAHFASIDNRTIIRAMDSFAGVGRRLDIVAEAGGIRLIDDFAHHPTEVAASISAVKEPTPRNRIWAIFEPRSTTSRSPLFQDEYRRALALADRVTIGPVPPRVDGADVLDTRAIADAIGRDGVRATAAENPEAIIAEVTAGLEAGTDLLVMSSGPFGGLVGKLRVLVSGR